MTAPFSYAQEDANTPRVYQPIVELPRLDPDSQSAEEYVQALFFLSIAAAAILAFIKIMYAGIKWMLSDVVTDKQSAKKDIWGALFGLAIVLSAVLVLTTINPNLVRLNIFGDAPQIGPTNSDSDIVGYGGQTGKVQIGGQHGMWCMGEGFLGIFNFECSQESKDSLARWTASCENDAGGKVQGDLTGKYTCVAK